MLPLSKRPGQAVLEAFANQSLAITDKSLLRPYCTVTGGPVGADKAPTFKRRGGTESSHIKLIRASKVRPGFT